MTAKPAASHPWRHARIGKGQAEKVRTRRDVTTPSVRSGERPRSVVPGVADIRDALDPDQVGGKVRVLTPEERSAYAAELAARGGR